MRHTILAVCLLLLLASSAFGQSTTVTLNVTDAGAQAWANGTYEFRLTPNPQYPNLGTYTWTGGTLLQSITGSLNGSGVATPSIPSNSAITPGGSTWTIKACPAATAQCFFSTATNITGATQTVTLTPPAIAITLSNPPGAFTLAYADAEIVSTPIGGQYFNLTSNATRTCTAVTGTTCNTWTSGGASNPAFSAITSGTNTSAAMVLGTGSSLNTSGTGSIGATNAGVFTHTQQDPFLFNTNGGGSACSPNNIFTSGAVNTNNLVYDAFTGCVNGPASGTLNNFSNGLAGLIQINDAGSTGFLGWAGGVGVAGVGFCSATGPAHCWGGNFSAADKSGNTGNFLAGVEVDMQVNNNGTTGFGYLASFQGNGQPTSDNFPAFAVNTQSGTGKFTTGFECKDTTVASLACLSLGKQSSGTSDSQFIFLNANDGTSALLAGFDLGRDHVIGYSAGFPMAVRSVATYLTSTAALSPNQLVKIDTANADSVVLCTTTDTYCQGVVAEIVSFNCGAAATTCPIITVPGSKAQGILGTGTCAIGNFVVVDTTTNGDVKCSATQPINGTWEGYALSSQSTIGQLLDYFFFPTRLQSLTAPTIAAAGCGGSAASIVVSNGPSAFKINVGTAPTSACTVTLPTATTGWNCFATDITTNSTSVFLQKQTGAESTTQATITNFSDVAVATAFVASDILKVACTAD